MDRETTEHHSRESVQNEIWLGAQAERVDHLCPNFDSTVSQVVTLGNLLQFSEAQFCFGYLVHVGTLQKVFDE